MHPRLSPQRTAQPAQTEYQTTCAHAGSYPDPSTLVSRWVLSTTPYLTIYDGPCTSTYAKQLGQLQSCEMFMYCEGTKAAYACAADSTTFDWAQMRTADGKLGWVKAGIPNQIAYVGDSSCPGNKLSFSPPRLGLQHQIHVIPHMYPLFMRANVRTLKCALLCPSSCHNRLSSRLIWNGFRPCQGGITLLSFDHAEPPALQYSDRYVLATTWDDLTVYDAPCTSAYGNVLATLTPCERFTYVDGTLQPYDCTPDSTRYDWIKIQLATGKEAYVKAGLPRAGIAYVGLGACLSLCTGCKS